MPAGGMIGAIVHSPDSFEHRAARIADERDTAPHDPDPAPDDADEPWTGPVVAHDDPSRPRGLDAPFAPGGDDTADDARRQRERRDLRLLLLFVAALVGIPSILTVIAVIVQLASMRSSG